MVPGFSMALALPYSILICFLTVHFPSCNCWNEPHGAWPVCAYTAADTKKTNARSAGIERCLIIGCSLGAHATSWLNRPQIAL